MDIYDGTNSFDFAMEIHYWLMYKNQKAEPKILSEVDESIFEKYFIDRFREVGRIDTFFNIMSDGHLWRMLIWCNDHDPDGLRKDIEKVLAGTPAQAIRLIKVFIPSIMTWSSDGSHETYKGAFLEKTYESITKLIEPEPIYSILRKAGYKPADVDFTAIDERSKMSDEEYAKLFMQCFDKSRGSTDTLAS